MKTLKILSLLMMSNKSKTAKKLEFDPETTVIRGTNDTGKSCALKSIYYTLGADVRHHEIWTNDKILSILKFSIDDIEYYILRSESFYSLFDSEKKLIGNYQSITKELSPVLSELFNYRIKMLDRQNNIITPPPAYIYLPFYLDQDESWKNNWNSFKHLQQLGNWRKPIVDYLTGIRPNEYYETKAESDRLKSKKRSISTEIKIQNSVYDRLAKSREYIVITYDVNKFEKEINELLVKLNELQAKTYKYKKNITLEYNRLSELAYQKKIIEESKKEIHADYEYATNNVNEDTVECPTCGAEYKNGFVERFEIAKDEESCDILLMEVIKNIKKVEKNIEEKKDVLSRETAIINDLKRILKKKKEKLTLKDVIDNESKISAKKAIKEEILKSESTLSKIDLRISSKEKTLREIDNKNRIRAIQKFYLEHMRSYLFKLNVNTLSEKSYKSMKSQIPETGSDLPRALLAYYFAILQTIFEKSTTTRFPIVIDSPNQNAQDPENLRRMYDFIISNKPKGSQLILGTEELVDLDYPGKVIELTHKYHILEAEDYEVVFEEMSPFIKESFELKA